MTPAAEAARVPARLAPPGSPQAEQLHHLHVQLSLGQSCHMQKVFSLCTQDHFGSVQLFVTLQTVACQASLSGTGGCCQNPCDPSSCTTSTPGPHRGKPESSRAASGANPNRGPTCSSVQFSHSFLSHSLQHHELQNARASLFITNSWSLPKLMSTESVMPSNHLSLCCPLLLLPSIFPSIRVFSNKSALRIRWPKDWILSFSISASNEHPGLISFRMDWLDLLAVQGTLKSFLQHHISKASILLCSAFFIFQLSHPYMTTGKTRPLLTK